MLALIHIYVPFGSQASYGPRANQFFLEEHELLNNVDYSVLVCPVCLECVYNRVKKHLFSLKIDHCVFSMVVHDRPVQIWPQHVCY